MNSTTYTEESIMERAIDMQGSMDTPADMPVRRNTTRPARGIRFDRSLDLGEASSECVPVYLVLPHVFRAIKSMRAGEVLRLTSGPDTLDAGIVTETMKSDIPGWCRAMSHVLLSSIERDGTISFYIRKRRSGKTNT
jgi:TusA-related sulfurtransferase